MSVLKTYVWAHDLCAQRDPRVILHPSLSEWGASGTPDEVEAQGYLAHKKPPPSRTLQKDHA